MNHVVGRVGFGGAAVGGDVAGAGALQHTDVAIMEPGTGVLAENEVTELANRCELFSCDGAEEYRGAYTAPSMRVWA